MRKKSNFILILSTLIALFGVGVTAISTMAWFQLTTVSNSVNNANEFDTDTTQLDVESISGYKYTYDQIADGVESDSGTISGQSAYGNIDEDVITDIDAPKEGVGFYILGDETWATAITGDTNDAMSYRASIKMSEQYDDNFAVIDGLHLVAEQQIAIKQYTYDEVSGSVKPVSYTISTLSDRSEEEDNDPSDFLTSSDGVLTVKTGQTGNYKMFINNRRQIYLKPSETAQRYPVPAGRFGVKIKKNLEDATENAMQVQVQLQGNAVNLGISSVKAHLWNIKFFNSTNTPDTSHIPDDIAPSSLPTITGVTWGGSAGSLVADIACAFDSSSNTHWVKAPWFIKSADCMFFDSSNSHYLKNTDGGDAKITGAVAGKYNKMYYGWGGDYDAWHDTANNCYKGHFSTGEDSNCTVSVPRYTVSYFKNSSSGTSLGTPAIKQYTYYTPESAYKTGGGQLESEWREWQDTSGSTFATQFITADTTVIGIYSATTYFKLFVAKSMQDGSTDTVQYDGNGVGYYTAFADTPFDPQDYLTDAAFASAFANYENYTAASATWKIGSTSGSTYDKSNFSSYGYTSGTAVSLYTTIDEKTLKVRKYAVKLSDDCGLVVWNSANNDATKYIEETWGADTSKTPADFTSENFTSLGFTNVGGYEKYDNSWRSGSAVGSSTINYPTTYGTTTTQDIYMFYKPKKNDVIYNYVFYIREKTGVTADGAPTYSAFSSYSKITGIRDRFDAFATTAFTVADHQPTHSPYVFSDIQDKRVLKFVWDGVLKNTATGEIFTSATFGPSSTAAERTFTVRMEATYESIYVANECTGDSNWNSCKNYYLQIRGRTDGGAADINGAVDASGNAIAEANLGDAYRFVMNRDANDGINSFAISDGISFAVSNGLSDAVAKSNITTTVTNTSSPDSYSAPRGAYSDTITITDGIDYGGVWNRQWRWSTYYGRDTKTAKIFFSDNSLSKAMIEGDGEFHLFVYDSGYEIEEGAEFAIRLTINGTIKWFDYDDLDDSSSSLIDDGLIEGGGALANLGDTDDDADDKSTAITVDNAIHVKTTATYNIYLNSTGKIAISTCPSKGDGYYIMSYDEDGLLGNSDTDSFIDGVKMKRTGYSYGYNVAYYSCFAVGECKDFYLKAYIGGVDYGPFTNLSSTGLASINDGVIHFASAGNYSIFIQLNLVNNQDVYTIFITEYGGNFYTLNHLPNKAGNEENKHVLDYNTTLILEVEFTYNASVANEAEIGIDIIRDATESSGDAKLSQYLIFNVLCSTTKLGTNAYDTMRGNSIYGAASAFATNALKLSIFDTSHPISASTVVPPSTPPSRYLYIMIDYKNFDVKNADNASLENDFTISLRARSK